MGSADGWRRDREETQRADGSAGCSSAGGLIAGIGRRDIGQVGQLVTPGDGADER